MEKSSRSVIREAFEEAERRGPTGSDVGRGSSMAKSAGFVR
jgi:hypothetical protein